MSAAQGAAAAMLLVGLLAGCGADGPPEPPAAAPAAPQGAAPAQITLSGEARLGVRRAW